MSRSGVGFCGNDLGDDGARTLAASLTSRRPVELDRIDGPETSAWHQDVGAEPAIASSWVRGGLPLVVTWTAEEADRLARLMTHVHRQGFHARFYCLNGEEPDIRRAFWRYVYGFEGEPEPPPADYCG